MSNLIGAVDKVSGLAKESVDASGDDNGLDLALFDSGAREDLVAGAPPDRQRLSGESRLVDLQRVSFQEPSIRRDNVSQLDANDISRHQYRSLLLTPPSIP